MTCYLPLQCKVGSSTVDAWGTLPLPCTDVVLLGICLVNHHKVDCFVIMSVSDLKRLLNFVQIDLEI